MPQIIEWVGASAEDIVWRYPKEEITWGAQLIVHEYEAAIFFRDGKAYDVFGPGRHTLTTMNLPLLTGVLTRVAGFETTPFKATVIFVSTKQFKGLFGASGQTVELAPLKFYGAFWFKVGDPKTFVMEVVGGQSAYTTEAVNSFLRGYMNERLITNLSKYDLVTVFTKLEEVSFKVKATVDEEFKRVGVDIIDLKFEGVDTTPEYRDRLFWIKQTGGAASQVLAMDTTKSVAESLSKSPGAAAGTGIVLVPQLMQQAAAGAALVICPSCKAQVPSTSKFCPSCGAAIQAPPPPPAQPPTAPPAGTVACPKCGTQNPSAAKFCMSCGTPLQATVGCPKCGSQNPANAKFCMNCGAALQPQTDNCPKCGSTVPAGSKFCLNCGAKLS
ncbi:MAG: SPFH domain-containing protein [Thermoproteota archaeon]|nr:SPFH domain-containing protein [Candidatus Brockarchaeota archaeon]